MRNIESPIVSYAHTLRRTVNKAERWCEIVVPSWDVVGWIIIREKSRKGRVCAPVPLAVIRSAIHVTYRLRGRAANNHAAGIHVDDDEGINIYEPVRRVMPHPSAEIEIDGDVLFNFAENSKQIYM